MNSNSDTIDLAEIVEELPSVQAGIEESMSSGLRVMLFGVAEDIRKLRLLGGFIKEHARKFDALQIVPDICGSNIDMNSLDRAKVLEVLRLFHGTWRKSFSGTALHYTLDIGNGLSLRMYNAALSDSCKLVEKKRVVPAREETYFEMDCGKGKPAEEPAF